VSAQQNTPMRKRRSQDEILELLQQFNNSGLTIKAFCTEQSLHPITFSKWRSRYKNNSKSAAFATFQIDDSISNHPALFAEIKGIRIYQPVSASFLKELL
jgi:transposase-like protein